MNMSGIMNSILQDDRTICFRCKSHCKTEEHHIFDGNPNRKLSEKYGLKVYLCHDCHNRDYKHKSIHFDPVEMLKLQEIGELAFLEYYDKTIDEFREIFGKNYLS